MDQLRPGVRDAFADEQAELGNVAEARERLMRAALANRDSHHGSRMQFAAGLAAIVIAALMIATFVYVRAGLTGRPSPAVTPHASATPAPLTSTLNVPDSTSIIVYGDPATPNQVDGMTWDGKQAGKIPGQPTGAGNPQNNRFAGPTEIHDRSGRLVAGIVGAKSFSGTWADDGAQFCQMAPLNAIGANGTPATLQLVTPGSAPRDIATVGKIYEQVVTSVAACSVRKDRAIVVQSYGNSFATAQYWMVQLSTGKILWTHSFVAVAAVTIAVSPGADNIAENTRLDAPVASTVYDSQGNVLAHIKLRVIGFSWDGSLAVGDSGQGSSTPPSEMSWQSRAPIWSAPAAFVVRRMIAQPDGAGVAIWIAPSAESTTSDLYVIASDGHVIARVQGTR